MQQIAPRRWRLTRFSLILLLLLAACADLSEPTPVAKRTPIAGQATPSAPTRTPAGRDDQTWLIMLYSDADDEILEEDMLNDINEAELVGSTDRVRVVAQVDRYDGGFDGDGDWTSTKRFYIEQDDNLEQMNSKELADLGEVNMADADTLTDFVTWAAKTYPSDKYVLIMSDHGAGWPGGWSDPDPSTTGRHDIPLAESFGDMLFLMEMSQALEHIIAETNIGEFELIGFDACLMSHVEVYSAIAPYARYAVASQEVEPSLGWAYAAILGRLTDSPEIDGAELSRAIVDSYIEQDQQILDDDARAKYVSRTYDFDGNVSAEEVLEQERKAITLTAIDLGKLPAVIDALDRLVITLAEAERKDIAAARRYTQAFESVFDSDQPKPYIDLGHFAQLLKQKVNVPSVNKAADDLIAAIDRSLIEEKHGDEKAGATGISIHFPNSKLYTSADAGHKSYNTVAVNFVNDSLWDEFLAFQYAKKPLPTTIEQPTATVERQPTPTPEPIDVTEVEAPGSEPITVAAIELSSTTASIDKPVVLTSSITGDNIAFVYIFIGYYDQESDTIQVLDMDYLDAEQTREIGGVFYPDWGEASTIDIEFEWDTQVFAMHNETTASLALFSPEDYGASPEDATYTVEGLYTTAKGKKTRRALLLFSNGELVQVLGYTGKEDTGSLREINPKRGDKFVVLDTWLEESQQTGESEFVNYEGETFVFGDDNFTWKLEPAPAGNYLVGFFAEDFDGNVYSAYETLIVE